MNFVWVYFRVSSGIYGSLTRHEIENIFGYVLFIFCFYIGLNGCLLVTFFWDPCGRARFDLGHGSKMRVIFYIFLPRISWPINWKCENIFTAFIFFYFVRISSNPKFYHVFWLEILKTWTYSTLIKLSQFRTPIGNSVGYILIQQIFFFGRLFWTKLRLKIWVRYDFYFLKNGDNAKTKMKSQLK